MRGMGGAIKCKWSSATWRRDSKTATAKHASAGRARSRRAGDGRHPGQGARRRSRRHSCAGIRIRAVVLFRGNLGSETEVRALTAALRKAMGPRALIAIDQEGGAVVRATFLPHRRRRWRSARRAVAVLAEEVGAAVARGVKSLGFNWNFAPVARRQQQPGESGDRRAQLLVEPFRSRAPGRRLDARRAAAKAWPAASSIFRDTATPTSIRTWSCRWSTSRGRHCARSSSSRSARCRARRPR